MKQSRVRQANNRSIKGELRTLTKKVSDAVAAGKIDEAEAGLKLVAKRLDQAGSKKAIHKNSAARRKSRLAHSIQVAKTKK